MTVSWIDPGYFENEEKPLWVKIWSNIKIPRDSKELFLHHFMSEFPWVGITMTVSPDVNKVHVRFPVPWGFTLPGAVA